MKQRLLDGTIFLATLTILIVSYSLSALAQSVSQGMATWYGPGFAGNRTANGERFNPKELTAAHGTLPFGTRVRVTNMRNGRSVIVRINDRHQDSSIVIDLSSGAAEAIGLIQLGTAMVKLEVLDETTSVTGNIQKLEWPDASLR
ncbi:hypothetical protein BST81_20345 [Leptolyngbya sp. 'hensonii']|uniref:septal ring lytic transglycosylase RlpA family protein n=1 Tax=Leptolyngbya sp. 'hensonii' TaxID=1922337 RepID=UPI0009502317|nr:septal ring lytic transglycosylase RlpA family protein [Leptolyngbya sp. 'hensonii']OLP16552.1 hypothetical protein BST81_20345 [Leptolyngbya sp. 'hensonii']